MLGALPKCLKNDLLFFAYSKAISSSLIFKSPKGPIDFPLSNSLIQMLAVRIYMKGDLIVSGGSTSEDTYILLDGEAVIFGMNEVLIGYLETGGHYSNYLDPEDEDRFEGKRPVHIVSKSITLVGIL